VVLLKRTYVFPWTQFLYAEGTDAEVRAAFSMHDLIVKGCGLESLLADLSAQHVTLLREPTRADTFLAPPAGPRVRAVEVRRVGQAATA
jgi:hypothetical protein